MTMCIVQAGKYGTPLSVDYDGVTKLQHFAMQQPLHLPVISNEDAGEALKLSAGIDLDSIRVRNQRVGEGRGRKKEPGEGEHCLLHGALDSIVCEPGKG